MNTQLVEIQPRELKFIVKVKNQSSCAVHLANVTDQYVAFKVKTTSPKKYCVRPNVGVIKPKSTCDFSVIMQAQKSAPQDLQCKDKFLIQSTVVAFGTTEDEITPGMFAKDSLKYIEETKLRVILSMVPDSPEKPQADAVLKQEASQASFSPKEPQSPVLLPVNGVNNQEPTRETLMPKDKWQNGVENLPPDSPIKKFEATTTAKNSEESREPKVMDNIKSAVMNYEEFDLDKDEKANQETHVRASKFTLNHDIEELRLKMTSMDAKLIEAQNTIDKLKEERNSLIREKETLKQELAIMRIKGGGGGGGGSARKVQVGFPPLFVCMVALISLMIGYWYRA